MSTTKTSQSQFKSQNPMIIEIRSHTSIQIIFNIAFPMRLHSIFASLFPLLCLRPPSTASMSIGICYGRIANNLPPPVEVTGTLKSNGITTVRLFNPDPATLQSFSGTGISLLVGVPNEHLPFLAAGSVEFAINWLQSNIFLHIAADQIRYIAVGNEVFLQDPYNTPHVVPAIMNLYQALQNLGLAGDIKLSSPQAASVLSGSFPPSSAVFNPCVRTAVVGLLQFLGYSGAPFMANVYPFLSYSKNPEPEFLNYALFGGEKAFADEGLVYSNLFDASLDAFVYAMEKEGFAGVPVVVTETGWPTAGGEGASVTNAMAYNGNVTRRVLNDVGTPKRPGVGVEVYLFDLFDENEKRGEEYEKHFGIFGLDGAKTYDLSFC